MRGAAGGDTGPEDVSVAAVGFDGPCSFGAGKAAAVEDPRAVRGVEGGVGCDAGEGGVLGEVGVVGDG